MKRCRICDQEHNHSYRILDDDLCEECEEAVLNAIADFRQEEEKEGQHNGSIRGTTK